MKIDFFNLHHLASGSIELNNFNVLVGKNNTNKTTLVQIIDVMFSQDYSSNILIDFFMKTDFLNKLTKKLEDKKFIEIDLINFLDDFLDDFFEYEQKKSKGILEGIKSKKNPMVDREDLIATMAQDAMDKKINKKEISIKRSFCEDDINSGFLQECKDIILKEQFNIVSYKKNANSPILSIYIEPNENDFNKIKEITARILVYIYSKLPIFTKNIKFFPVGRDIFLQYPKQLLNDVDEKVSNDFIKFYLNLKDMKEKPKKSFCFDEIENIEKEIFRGEFKFIDSRDSKILVLNEPINVIDKNTNEKKVVLQETHIKNFSSSAKALSILIYYLKYLVKEDDFIIIDELECSLHPASIKLFIETLLEISKKSNNLKILLVTHNDIIIETMKNIIATMNTENIEKYISIYEADKDNEILRKINCKDKKVCIKAFTEVYDSLRENRIKALFNDELQGDSIDLSDSFDEE